MVMNETKHLTEEERNMYDQGMIDCASGKYNCGLGDRCPAYDWGYEKQCKNGRWSHE